MQNNPKCPIWGDGNGVSIHAASTHAGSGEPVIDVDALITSPRAGGPYRLAFDADYLIRNQQVLSEGDKARLTTWLVDQRRHGNSEPVITWDIANSFRLTDDRDSLSVSKRAERLLIYLAHETKTAGDLLEVHYRFREALAWSESTELHEVYFLLRYLRDRGLIDEYYRMAEPGDPCFAIVTVQGFGFIEEITRNPDSTQAFVAMWFSEKMNEAYCKGIKPAIEETGYKALRIDLKPDVKERLNKSTCGGLRRMVGEAGRFSTCLG